MNASTSVVTRKGQVTIPITMRQALGLKEGDRVVFMLTGDSVVMEPASSLVSRLLTTAGAPATQSAPLSREQFDEAIAAGFAEDEEAHMEEIGLGPAVRGRQRATPSDPSGSPGAFPEGGGAA